MFFLFTSEFLQKCQGFRFAPDLLTNFILSFLKTLIYETPYFFIVD